jgi:hypothetical protein
VTDSSTVVGVVTDVVEAFGYIVLVPLSVLVVKVVKPGPASVITTVVLASPTGVFVVVEKLVSGAAMVAGFIPGIVAGVGAGVVSGVE